MSTATTVRFNDETKENIERFAKLTKRSRSFIINAAVEEYIEHNLAYMEELDKAVESIKTEPTYAAQDVHEWMNSWGTEQEKPLANSRLYTDSK
ncbi:MAG: hypothetical protein JKY08_05985 [Flavobacteriaceae bacterium]|nr:hypothetical protein [Flavobacteriaceae bacterium]